MKNLLITVIAISSLVACGGGGGSNSSAAATSSVSNMSAEQGTSFAQQINGQSIALNKDNSSELGFNSFDSDNIINANNKKYALVAIPSSVISSTYTPNFNRFINQQDYVFAFTSVSEDNMKSIFSNDNVKNVINQNQDTLQYADFTEKVSFVIDKLFYPLVETQSSMKTNYDENGQVASQICYTGDLVDSNDQPYAKLSLTNCQFDSSGNINHATISTATN